MLVVEDSVQIAEHAAGIGLLDAADVQAVRAGTDQIPGASAFLVGRRRGRIRGFAGRAQGTVRDPRYRMRGVEMVTDTPSPSSRSDEDAWCAALVERVAAGEAQALEELYDRYARPAYSLARRVTGDPAFAEEAVQEVFLAVWRQPDASRPAVAGSPAGCSPRCTTRRSTRSGARRRCGGARSHCRRSKRWTRPTRTDEPARGAVEERMRGEQVRRALRTLPDSQREAMTLAYYGGYTQREIASLTGTRRSAP